MTDPPAVMFWLPEGDRVQPPTGATAVPVTVAVGVPGVTVETAVEEERTWAKWTVAVLPLVPETSISVVEIEFRRSSAPVPPPP